MKKLVFTFLTMVVFAFVANTTFAQSTWLNAFVNGEHTYTVSDLTENDTWDFIITNDGVDLTNPSAVPTASTNYSFLSGETGTVDGTEIAEAEIKWLVAGTYRVWIRMTDNTTGGCYNYRYQTVTVSDYPVFFDVVALMAGDNYTEVSEITGTTGGATVTDCPGFVNEEFNNEASTTEGSTYVYFKISRKITSGSTSSSDWTFTPSSNSNANVTGWEYSYDGGATAWADITVDNSTSFTADGSETDVVYIRCTLTNIVETDQAVQLNIGDSSTSTAFENTGNVTDNTTGDDMSTINLSQIPSVGGFSGN